jgi:hypothetical protein
MRSDLIVSGRITPVPSTVRPEVWVTLEDSSDLKYFGSNPDEIRCEARSGRRSDEQK